jgi:hypothetical protein
MDTHQLLVERATAELKQLGLNAAVVDKSADLPTYAADAWLCVTNNGMKVDYAVKVKSRLAPATLGAVTMQLKRAASANSPLILLVTEYVSPPMARTLREQKQQFADAVGNIYLEAPGLLVFVTGRKPQVGQALSHAGKAHTLTGLKVIFALLCDPALANAPHRAIAAAAGVALGAIPAVLADLQHAGHLLVLAKQRQLNATKRLLDEWALAYAWRLRAKTLQATYTASDFDGWKTWQLDFSSMLWGGEPAANLMVNYLVPGVLTIYANKLTPELLIGQKMTSARGVQAADRVLEWRKPFWGALQWTAQPGTVHPVLVYADLLSVGDARCIETAQLIYDKHLARLLPAA